ncbi:MAG: hypothetical protein QM779_08975 [Propionicimonas sp.]|uniref:hypothetical protein n=1 Tax=Propionicimonas sp. TaxID=1955623 RepID=UPI003D0AFC80
MVQLMLVTPDWLPLAMVGVLVLLLAFLYWSMHRNINRIDFDDEQAPTSPVSPLD